MIKSVVYEGENLLGEVEIYFQNNNNNKNLELMKGMRISHYSEMSERCPPLAVLHTITKSSGGICFKMMESSSHTSSNNNNNNKFYFQQQQQQQESQLLAMHSNCIRDNKVKPLNPATTTTTTTVSTTLTTTLTTTTNSTIAQIKMKNTLMSN